MLGHFSMSLILDIRFEESMAVSKLEKSLRKERSFILKLLKLRYFRLTAVYGLIFSLVRSNY